jgi:hypothetical protein
MTPNRKRLVFVAPWIAFGALLLATWFVYRPGLGGGFVFDDFVNLDALGKTGPIDNWPTFWRYITSGAADSIGRPLSLLTFLLDARDWPADPRPFLRTNILFHAANVALLFSLLRQLGRRLPVTPTQSQWAALIGAGLWALHPLHVSTTLYIVQREAMLAGTFMLLGLLTWSHGRTLAKTSPRRGTWWMLAGIGAGTGLAILCKANGALLPLLACVLEATVFRETGFGSRAAKRVNRVLLIAPSILLFSYVLLKSADWSAPLAARPWTIGERILTEPRVLLDYLRLLLVPRVLSTGVYNDSYAWSTGLLHPVTTLPALLAIATLLVSGWLLRRKAPVLSAAILFFFAGHLLESTSLPLELYFEHRNYVPAMLLGWPLGLALVQWQAPIGLRTLLAGGILALLAMTTWQRTSLWADQPRMARLWVAVNPNSSRALATQALFDMQAARPDLAAGVLRDPWRHHPDDLQLGLNFLSATCMIRGPSAQEVTAVATALARAKSGEQLAYSWLNDMLSEAGSKSCPGVDLDTLEQWTQAALANPRVEWQPDRRQGLHALLGRIALARNDATTASREFRSALAAWPTPQAAARQAAWMAGSGHPAEALALLDDFDRLKPRQADRWSMSRVHAWVLAKQGYWPREFNALRLKLRADLASGGSS